MRPGGGKHKGSAFERDICRKLSLWLTKGKREDVFWRSSLSGGRSTVALRSGVKLKTQSGDISAIHKLGSDFVEQFMIECKHHKDLKFLGIFKDTGLLIKFWDEAIQNAHNYNQIPIMITKQNNWPVLVCLTNEGAKRFKLQDNMFHIISPVYNMRIMLFELFLEINPSVVRFKDGRKRKRKRIRIG